jgi:hypothetical protein
MKQILFIMSTWLILGFADGSQTETIEGLWTGVYKTEDGKETVIVKFEAGNQVELYCGVVEAENRSTGTYTLKGDSVLIFRYVDAEGNEFIMEGNINKRKTYVDGLMKSGKNSGSFFLRKEKIQELFI